MKVDLRKKPLLKAYDPFTGQVFLVRVLEWDKARKVASVVDGSDTRRTIPFSYLVVPEAA